MPRHTSNDRFPRTVAELLEENPRFDPAALAAVRALARAKPWRGTVPEKLAKLNACATALCDAYGMEPVTVARGGRLWNDPVAVGVDPEQRRILYPDDSDYMSVVTFLHVFCRLRGLSVRRSFAWSINVFRRCFPQSYARCVHVGPFLFTPARAAALGLAANPMEGN